MARERREVWAKRIERWRDSGLTLKEFAAEIGVNANTLSGWRWRLGVRAARGEARQRVPSAPAFVEVVAAPTAIARSARAPELRAAFSTGGELLEVVLRSGHRVRVPAVFDPSALRRIVDALEAR